MSEKELVMVYDTDLRRPACVLIQAAYGCDPRLLSDLGFDARSWLLAPTPGMKKLSATRERWLRVVAMSDGGVQ